jgi:tRNA (guanine-N7-)-methyltransferase
VDLGCGRGDYLLARARSEPGIGLVGIELRFKWIVRIREIARREGLTNLRILRCDAQHDLPLLFAPGGVRGFTIHHPDPWWKKRHRKRRLVRAAYLERLAWLLEPGGFVFYQTDVPDMATEVAQAFAGLAQFVATDAAAMARDRLGGAQSHRARKCHQLGIPVVQLAYLRTDTERA